MADEGKKQELLEFEELDELSSKELHDRATRYAERHLDLKFFWDLMKEIPAAEAAGGEIGNADHDVMSLSRLVADQTEAGRGKLADDLRPFYIDYLLKHSKPKPS